MSEKTARVAQVWPASLKEEVRQLVGHRGMTDFTIAAVREKLYSEKDEEVQERLRAAPEATTPNAASTRRGRRIEDVSLPDEPTPEPAKCPTCDSPLVDGECWSCF